MAATATAILSLLLFVITDAASFTTKDNDWLHNGRSGAPSLITTKLRHFLWDKQGNLDWTLILLVGLCGLIPILWFAKFHYSGSRLTQEAKMSLRSKKDYVTKRVKPKTFSLFATPNDFNPDYTDPGLLRKHSEFRSFTIPSHGFTYSGIRVFYRPHPQESKLPTKPSSLPLIVVIHGLGGSLAQFHPLLVSLVNFAPCLGIDLPGCGRSTFSPTKWGAYKTECLVELLSVAIESYRDKKNGQGIVFVGHSMGSSLAALLASTTSPYPYKLSEHALGLLAICPPMGSLSQSQASFVKKLLYVPDPIFDLWRRWDRRGGTESGSVKRFVGEKGDPETKKLQLKFNEQSQSRVWRRFVGGLLPQFNGFGLPKGGLASRVTWAGLDVPVYLIAGEDDAVTKPVEMEKIAKYIHESRWGRPEGDQGETEDLPDSAAPVDVSITPGAARESNPESKNARVNVSTTSTPADGASITAVDEPLPQNQQTTAAGPEVKPQRVLKTTILPSPAAHALLYTSATTRTLAGLMADFMATHISPRLSLGWQLQYLSTEGKWDVKNLKKWQSVVPVSGPIGGVFRAMKTLREVDDRHRPDIFVREWSDTIKHVIDISHENPVYDPQGLNDGGIIYHKFPTVSKMPPSPEEVKDFIALVDGLLREQSLEHDTHEGYRIDTAPIGVHCHYGYNRTGFFLISYLVERRGYGLQVALDEFAKQRSPGIKHEHFIDTLFVRYCVGLKKQPTF
ncbi:MAG: hypothetical protein M1833_002186 [Piccolia ochrophora]|nr:MAG: hypothetical protein M1833_002186 [Piccolia ochrophora]